MRPGPVPRALEAAAVERLGVERRDIDVVETANVDRDHLLSARRSSARECPDAALRTEQVVDGLLAELVILEVVRAGAQGEMLRRDEAPQRAALLTDRAVAGDDGAEVERHLETHLAAMAAAGMGLGLGHGYWSWNSMRLSGRSRSTCKASHRRFE